MIVSKLTNSSRISLRLNLRKLQGNKGKAMLNFNWGYKKEFLYLNSPRGDANLKELNFASPHPLQRLFNQKPANFKRLVTRRNLSPFNLLIRQTDEGNRVQITWTKETSFPEIQKIYQSPQGAYLKNTVFESENQVELYKFNNLGFLGRDLSEGEAINLFIGCSVMFSLGINANLQMAFDTLGKVSEKIPEFLDEVKVPYYEYCQNANASVEGANFSIIIKRLNHIINDCRGKNISIKNLFIWGGWHNLIYNENSLSYWEESINTLSSCGIPLTLVTLCSPVNKLSFDELEAFVNEKGCFWGNLTFDKKTIFDLKRKISDYNNFVRAQTNCSIIDLDKTIKINAQNASSIFLDVVQFNFEKHSRRLVIDAFKTELASNKSSYMPRHGAVSKYIYPIL